MTEEEEKNEKDTTGPPDGKTHEATTPPGQGERDEEAIRKGEENLDRAGRPRGRRALRRSTGRASTPNPYTALLPGRLVRAPADLAPPALVPAAG